MKPEHKDGLRRQLERFRDADRAGWKVGLTSGGSRDAMGVGFRPFGHIERSRIYLSGSSLVLADIGAIGVENELCFHFGESVPQDADRESITTCINAIKPAFELNQRRLDADASDADRLADNLSQYGIVVGEAFTDFSAADLHDLSVTLFCDDSEVATTASKGHIDDHLDSLLALVASLAHFDRQIEAGDHVITGAFARESVKEPSVWRGDFSLGIGSVEVSFT